MALRANVHSRTPKMTKITFNIIEFLNKIEQTTNSEEIKTLLETVSDNIRPIVEPIALDRIEQLKSNLN